MDNETNYIIRPVFKNQPIACPWVNCQPYPSPQLIKNKLGDFAKKYSCNLNASSSKKSSVPSDSYNLYGGTVSQQPSSTYFFYFLRLMQLFPDTHPATLHTVLTLSKNNFFFAIDKLLYAQKCKNDMGRKYTYGGRGRSFLGTRGRNTFARPTPRYQQQALSRAVPNDLAEVQRIIDLAEKPYINVQSVEENASSNEHDQQITRQVMKICVDNHDQLAQGRQTTFVETENHEVIEIVCFDNDQTILKQNKDDDMEIETFNENMNASIGHGVDLSRTDEETEPPVIVVSTMQDEDSHYCGINEDSLVEPCELNEVSSADLTDNSINDNPLEHDHSIL